MLLSCVTQPYTTTYHNSTHNTTATIHPQPLPQDSCAPPPPWRGCPGFALWSLVVVMRLGGLFWVWGELARASRRIMCEVIKTRTQKTRGHPGQQDTGFRRRRVAVVLLIQTQLFKRIEPPQPPTNPCAIPCLIPCLILQTPRSIPRPCPPMPKPRPIRGLSFRSRTVQTVRYSSGRS